MKYNYYDIYKILSNLHDLYDDGMALYYCFNLLEDVHLTKRYKKSIIVISENIRRGESISSSFNKTAIYPSFLIEILASGEDNGSLSNAFNILSKYYYEKYKIRKRIISAVTYPLFLLILLLIFANFLIFIFIPEVYESFIDIQKEMPEVLTKIYSFAMYIKSISWIYIIILVFLIIAFITALSFLTIKSGILKKIFSKTKSGRRYIEYRFMMFLRTIVISGSPISNLIKMDIDYNSIGFSKNDISILIDGVKNGLQLSSILSKYQFISKYTISMIKIGESRGKLSESLDSIACFLERKINNKMNKVAEFVQPFFICIVACIVIAIIICLVGPILDMMDLKGGTI